jgi:hypothetical protein
MPLPAFDPITTAGFEMINEGPWLSSREEQQCGWLVVSELSRIDGGSYPVKQALRRPARGPRFVTAGHI